MVETPDGEYRPQPAGPCGPTGTCGPACRQCISVCPFSDTHGQDEESLGRACFAGDTACLHDPILGWVRDTFAGGLRDEAERLKAPSGGLTTAVLCRLLETGQIDAATVLEPLAGPPWHRARIATSVPEVLASRGSVYHATPLDQVVAQILTGPERRYALVGLPCVVKALRLAQARIPALRRRIRYILGLTCSGQRSLVFPEILAALMGRSDGSLCYRSKRLAHHSRDYRAELSVGPSIRSVRMLGLFGYLWVNGVGRYKSCLFCDDVFAELADATFMDAWLPEYRADRRGTSLVVSRSTRLSEVIRDLFASGTCEGGPIAASKVVQSQIDVVRERREGMAARCQATQARWGYAPRTRSLSESVDSTDSTVPGAPQLREAMRELAYTDAVRAAIRRFHAARWGRRGWLGRLRAWGLCAKVLWLAGRYGLLGRTLRAIGRTKDRAGPEEV